MDARQQVGAQLTPQQQQYADAAASLTPDKSLQRIDDLAKFVFANVAVIGTVLTGFGLFTAGAQTLNRGPSLLGLPLTIALVGLSLAIGALLRRSCTSTRAISTRSSGSFAARSGIAGSW